jgi:tetratricopeptide (TPR) repeat protein
LFRRLAVFVGGWTLETAEKVCSGDGIEPDLILDLLSQLVKKSLVVMTEENGESRYHFLETIRQYASEKLFESGEGEKARNRHLQAFDEMAEKAELKLTGSEQIGWLDRLEFEHGNLRAALEWSIESNVETGLRLGSALWRFWLVRGYLTEGREWLEQLLSAPGNAQSDYVISRAKALYVASHLSLTQGDNARGSALADESLTLCRKTDDHQQLAFSLAIAGRAANLMDDLPRAETLYAESLEMFQVSGDERGTRLVLSLLGTLAYSQDDMQRAKELQEQCLLLQKKIGDKWEITETLNYLGQIARSQGDFEHSIEIHEEGLELARELGSKPGIAHGLNLLAWVVREQGDYKRAALLYEECLVMSRELGNKWRIAGVLNGLGVIAWRQGYFERAKALLEESLDLRQEIGNKVWIVYGQINLGDVLRSQGSLAQAAVLYKDALSALINLHSPNWDLLECLRRIAAVTGAQKGVKKAAILFGAVETLQEIVTISLPPLDRADYDRDVAIIREQLGKDSFDQAWCIGKSMSMEELFKYVLEETDE